MKKVCKIIYALRSIEQIKDIFFINDSFCNLIKIYDKLANVFYYIERKDILDYNPIVSVLARILNKARFGYHNFNFIIKDLIFFGRKENYDKIIRKMENSIILNALHKQNSVLSY